MRRCKQLNVVGWLRTLASSSDVISEITSLLFQRNLEQWQNVQIYSELQTYSHKLKQCYYHSLTTPFISFLTANFVLTENVPKLSHLDWMVNRCCHVNKQTNVFLKMWKYVITLSRDYSIHKHDQRLWLKCSGLRSYQLHAHNM